jgi:hypothetical protein
MIIVVEKERIIVIRNCVAMRSGCDVVSLVRHVLTL